MLESDICNEPSPTASPAPSLDVLGLADARLLDHYDMRLKDLLDANLGLGILRERHPSLRVDVSGILLQALGQSIGQSINQSNSQSS